MRFMGAGTRVPAGGLSFIPSADKVSMYSTVEGGLSLQMLLVLAVCCSCSDISGGGV